MNKNNFSVIKKVESINITEWTEKHPKWFAIVEADETKPGYGWIKYRGPRPMPTSLDFLIETNDFDTLKCDPHKCYEIIASKIRLPKHTILTESQLKSILKAKN